MFPFSQILPAIMATLVTVFFDPLFWVVVLLVALQYRRMAAARREFFGLPGAGGVWRDTVVATGYGLLGGFLGSFLMVLIGLSLTGSGLIYLWPVAILLMLINARFLCFAYAGGVLSLSNLLFGFPEIHIAQVLALVAILHLVESALILTSGHLGAVPVYFKSPAGQVIGGFTLQRFWPIPIVALAVVGPAAVQQGVAMPDWWPLLKPGVSGDAKDLVYTLIPVVAGLGYGDLAISRSPGEKSRLSALFLGAYSLCLLLLAVLSQYVRGLAFLAALFSPLGHEMVIYTGKKVEFLRRPLFVPPPRGVGVLDVVPDSPAWRAGIRSGDVVLFLNQHQVNSRPELEMVLADVWGPVEVQFLRGQEQAFHREVVFRAPGRPFGFVPVPDGSEEAVMDLSTAGPLGRLWQDFRRRIKR
ncbi:PDZ domain-containing protein [Desulfofundulus thermosubterraneus]|uniref:PDZ domain-containing protein n=1 Tax=Desulfofundulus thermosubterraneus DSM 16057 TaxID=1121432 RepID=A0A1M6C310_9FIRM|nr:PDZ domain-containing protein [Desulfofundulus thermosubterraneus]SHI55201.1 PDZ domain-containing protein [Desulfofundulus thermosubterraneus DSM 16057]